MNTCVQVFLYGHMFPLLLGIYQGVELLDHMVTLFKLLRNCKTMFQSSCTILHSYQRCMRVPVSLHPHQHLLFSVFFIIAILVGVKQYLTLVLTWISLIANDVKQLFMCLLAIYTFSLERCLFRFFVHFEFSSLSFYY